MKRIPLSQNQFALVDDDDFERINQYNWYLGGNYYKGVRTNLYAIRRPNVENPYGSIHRMIMLAPAGCAVDHIDGNGLNDQKSNLRLATAFQNSGNRKNNSNRANKGIRLVGSGRYQANLKTGRKSFYLGTFDTIDEAEVAYDQAAVQIWGAFAKTNAVLKGSGQNA